MEDTELDLTQMHPLLQFSSIFVCQAACLYGGCPPSAPLSLGRTALPGLGWEYGRKENLDVDTICCKGCNPAVLCTYCPE